MPIDKKVLRLRSRNIMRIDECCLNSPSADQGEKLYGIKGSNKTMESPSVVSRKRKRTDKGDGTTASNITSPEELHIMIQKAVKQRGYEMLKKLQCEAKEVLNGSESELDGLGAAASKLITWKLHLTIQESLKLMELLKLKMIDSESQSGHVEHLIQLGQYEAICRLLVRGLKQLKQLPHQRCDPATTSNFVSTEMDISALSNMQPPKEKHHSFGISQLDSILESNEGDGAAASKIIPPELHQMIQKALELRGYLMLNKLEGESKSNDLGEHQLELYEDLIRNLVKRLKKQKELRRDWEYDPATASTFVAAETDISALPKMPPRRLRPARCCSWVIDPDQKFPKTTDVRLDEEEEKKIWMNFKEFDKDMLGLSQVDFSTVHEYEIPLLVDDPIALLTSKFAVTAFNEAIEMYVKKGEQNNIHDFDIVECKYLKLNNTSYYFYITIEAFEERKRGVYDTKVKLNWDDGSRSLMHFVLTDRKPRDDKKTMKRKTHPDSWQDCSGIPHSGMRPRRNRRSICRGYDYQYPWGFDGP